jgi:hypothetical protein
MSRRFSSQRPTVGANLPPDTYGRLVGEFQSSSHIPLRGGRDTGRHLFLSVKVPQGPSEGIFECAVNIRSDDDTEVLYAERMENLDPASAPPDGFDANVDLSYGGDPSHPDSMGLTDADFHPIVNDDLYNRIADLAQNCDRIAAYGVTYQDGSGIHDIHMHTRTEIDDPGAPDGRVYKDGAIAFYFHLEAAGQTASYATWVFIKFGDQNLVSQ